MEQMKWLKPSEQIKNYKIVVLFYHVFADPNEEDKCTWFDIFVYDKDDIFMSINTGEEVYYRQIIRWFPLPGRP